MSCFVPFCPCEARLLSDVWEERRGCEIWQHQRLQRWCSLLFSQSSLRVSAAATRGNTNLFSLPPGRWHAIYWGTTKRDTRGHADTNTIKYTHIHLTPLISFNTGGYIQIHSLCCRRCQISERTYSNSLIEGHFPGAAPNCEKFHAAIRSSGAKEAETKRLQLVDEPRQPRHCRIYVGIVRKECCSWCDFAAQHGFFMASQ